MKKLLRLLSLRYLPVSPLRSSFRTRFRVHQIVPPPEAARVVTDEALMVDIMVVGASPKGKEVVETPRELIATVSIDGLEESTYNPCVHSKEMQLAVDGAEDDWTEKGSEAQHGYLNRRRVFCSHAKRRRILVMYLVDVLVEGAPVQSTVRPVVPGILHNEEECKLPCHGEQRREGYASTQAEELCHGMEEPDLRKFDREMT